MDLAQPLQVGWYNDAVESHLRLPDFERPHSLAIVIGNSRALWSPLLAALRADPILLGDDHPVERYAMAVVAGAVSGVGVDVKVRWSHTLGDGMVAMQRLADIAGLAYLSPAHLSVHPTYGPWIALRAAVVLDIEGPTCAAPPAPPPCDACDTACLPVLRGLMACPPDQVARRDWVAVRDACPTGRGYRYSEEQIDYHYCKDLAALRALARA